MGLTLWMAIEYRGGWIRDCIHPSSLSCAQSLVSLATSQNDILKTAISLQNIFVEGCDISYCRLLIVFRLVGHPRSWAITRKNVSSFQLFWMLCFHSTSALQPYGYVLLNLESKEVFVLVAWGVLFSQRPENRLDSQSATTRVSLMLHFGCSSHVP